MLNWLARRKLVLNKYDCDICGNGCTLKRRSASADVYFWFCNTCKKSVRHGSFFSASKLPLQKIILLMYFWANQYQQQVAKHELGIGRSNTVSDWYNFCRDVKVILLVNQRKLEVLVPLLKSMKAYLVSINIIVVDSRKHGFLVACKGEIRNVF